MKWQSASEAPGLPLRTRDKQRCAWRGTAFMTQSPRARQHSGGPSLTIVTIPRECYDRLSLVGHNLYLVARPEAGSPQD